MPVYYTNQVLDHFYNPRNCGELIPADSVGVAEITDHSIVIRFSARIMDRVIVDIHFKTLGCITSVASASMVTELVKGKTIEDAWKLSDVDVSNALGGLPEEKMYCSRLAIAALQQALENYTIERNKTP